MKAPFRIRGIVTLVIATGFVGMVTASGSLPSLPTGSSTETSSDYPPRPRVNCQETIKPPSPRCANFDCDDPLFKRYPSKGTWISQHCYEFIYPFSIYDTDTTVMFGSADLAALRAITERSGYHPVATDTGRGIAVLFVALHKDTTGGPYFETGLMFSVNETPTTVSSENPYSHVSEFFRPEFEVWFVKLLLSEHLPIEYGREILGYDKNPLPQNMVVSTAVDMKSVETTFRFEDPQFNRIMSGRIAIDKTAPARAEALSLLAAVPGGGNVVAKALTEGGLVRVNVVSPDPLHRTDELVKTHFLFRAKSIELGPWGAGSTLTVNPDSDYGAAISRIDFRPVVSFFLAFRLVVDNGHVP